MIGISLLGWEFWEIAMEPWAGILIRYHELEEENYVEKTTAGTQIWKKLVKTCAKVSPRDWPGQMMMMMMMMMNWWWWCFHWNIGWHIYSKQSPSTDLTSSQLLAINLCHFIECLSNPLGLPFLLFPPLTWWVKNCTIFYCNNFDCSRSVFVTFGKCAL